jgi:tetratricopeptide (TPR) repeat protein
LRGSDYLDQRDTVNALRYVMRARELCLADLGANNVRCADTRVGIGNVHLRAGDAVKALAEYTAVYAQRSFVLGADHPRVAEIALNMAVALKELRRYGEARALLEQADALLARKRFDVSHPQRMTLANNLANVVNRMGDPVAAQAQHAKVLALRRAALAPNHPDLAMSWMNHGLALARLGRPREAVVEFEQSLVAYADQRPVDATRVSIYLGLALLGAGERARAAEVITVTQAQIPTLPDLASTDRIHLRMAELRITNAGARSAAIDAEIRGLIAKTDEDLWPFFQDLATKTD